MGKGVAARRAVLLWAALAAVMLAAGCGNAKPVPAAPSVKIGSGLTLRYWAPGWLGNLPAARTQALPLFGKLEEATGVRIEIIQPSTLYAVNQLVELRAIGAMPDIIEWSWLPSYPGGPGQAIDDGLVAPLGDLISRYAPNLLRVLSRSPEIGRSLSTPDGRYYAFPDLSTDPSVRARSGPLFRRAWLEKIGAKPPETIGAWEETLRAFKNNSFGTPGTDPEYPLFIRSLVPYLQTDLTLPDLLDSNAFAGAFGISHGFFRAGGVLRYGPVQPEYKRMMALLASWYRQGFLHPSITDPRALINVIETVAKCGAWIGSVEAAEYLKALDWVPAPLPRLEGSQAFQGPTLRPAYAGDRAAAVAASSKYKIQAVRWLDLAYGEWGSLLFNFGIEGKSYGLERGTPVLSEAARRGISKGSGGGTRMMETFFSYARGWIGGPYDVSADLFRQVEDAWLSGSSAAFAGWAKGAQTDPLSVLDADAGRRDSFYGIYAPIRQHFIRNFLAFVCGQRDLAEFNRFKAEVEEMGLPEAMAILEKADAAWRAKPNLAR